MLSPRQAAFVATLVSGASKQEAAARAGVSERCGRRWLGMPQVKQALAAAVDEALAGATRRTVAAMGEALHTLEEISSDREQPAAARVSAAGRILESGPKLRDAFELAARVAELEARWEAQRGYTKAR